MGAEHVEYAFFWALLGMALAAFACRVAGFLLMGHIRITPRIESAMRATPLAVMVGIATPAAVSGRVPETVALIAVMVATRLTGSDFVAAVTGAGTVALLRWMGL